MALLPSIMSLFGGKPTTPPAADPSTQQQQQASAATNPSIPNATTPASTGQVPAIPVAATGDASPLANFADLWKTDPNTTQVTPSLVPSFNLDVNGLLTAAKATNFTNHIAPDLVAKAMAGDGPSFMEVINQATQLGFANAVASSGEIIKNSLGSAQGVLKDSVLPAAFRDQQITQALHASNPIFSDPAVAPMMGMLKTQLAQKFPTAPAAEIAEMATQYLSGMSSKIATASGATIIPKGQQSPNQPQQQQTDWTTFFNA